MRTDFDDTSTLGFIKRLIYGAVIGLVAFIAISFAVLGLIKLTEMLYYALN